jgi:hypothetical protein
VQGRPGINEHGSWSVEYDTDDSDDDNDEDDYGGGGGGVGDNDDGCDDYVNDDENEDGDIWQPDSSSPSAMRALPP